jgi:hypothetical protein
VSPVPLKATYEDRHVLVSNTYSKAALRVVAEEIAATEPDVTYFPSYEIVTSAGDAFFCPDRRTVTEAGVRHVMAVFRRHYLSDVVGAIRSHDLTSAPETTPAELAAYEAMSGLVCEEDALDPARAA